MRYIITLLLAAIPVFALAEQSFEWRDQAQALIDENKISPALFMLEEAGNRINEIADESDQVNAMRYLGELYAAAEKPDLAARWFTDAINKSLEMQQPWQRLSAVISVLELHRKAIPEHQGLVELIRLAQATRLLTAAGQDAEAKEITRYIKCMDGAATKGDARGILQEMRSIEQVWLRKRVLLAMLKITYAEEQRYVSPVQQNPPYEADAEEKFLWQLLDAKLSRSPATTAQFSEGIKESQRMVEQLPPEKRRWAKKLIQSVAR